MTRASTFGIILFALSARSTQTILENDTAKRDKAIINSQISERETPCFRGSGSALASAEVELERWIKD